MIRVSMFLGLLMSTQAVAQQGPNNEEPILCVDTLDCGGICGTQQEVNVFLAQCNGGPAGPCFDDCWSACDHSNSVNNNPNLSACTQECVTAACPADAANQGLTHAGHLDSCPVPAADAICYMIYAPVDCGGCVYSNGCLAEAAGMNSAACQDVGEQKPIE